MKFLKVFLVILFLQNLAFAGCGSKHHIFLLHGIGGSKKTFGSLDRVLGHLNPCNRTYSFEYKTGSLLTPKDFARHFHDFVNGLDSLGKTDKVSLVMHSQGGLVGSLWLKHLVTSKHPLLAHLDSFITLSTPLWGTDIADVGKKIFYTLPPGMVNPISPFGRNELNEMTYGSASVLEFVNDLEKTFASVPNLRPLFIAGIKKIHNSTLGEDDVVVPLHSMQPSRYFLKDEFSLLDKNRSPASAFEKSTEKPFIIVPADHIKLLGQPGVADIPKKCVRDFHCSHPSVLPILGHLEGKSIEQEEEYSLTRFRFTFYLKNPELMKYDPKKLSV
ncbi:MAG: esterase/lipase family protein [Bacteriovoracia bacterium]